MTAVQHNGPSFEFGAPSGHKKDFANDGMTHRSSLARRGPTLAEVRRVSDATFDDVSLDIALTHLNDDPRYGGNDEGFAFGYHDTVDEGDDADEPEPPSTRPSSQPPSEVVEAGRVSLCHVSTLALSSQPTSPSSSGLKGDAQCTARMSTDSLAHFLHTHTLGELLSTLESEEVTLPDLKLLTDDDLKALGLKVGPRARLRDAIRQHFGRTSCF